jgi:asparagine synthase (glutamine-hydrolysing)
VLFSGGLDSSIVAALLAKHCPVTLYTVGTEESYDINAGREGAEALGLPWKAIIVREPVLLDAVSHISHLAGTVNPIIISFEIPLYFVSKHAREATLFGGQGADELFAGYARYVDMEDQQRSQQMDTDMARLMNETLAHEKAIAGSFQKEVRYPYLHPKVMEMVRRMPMEEKMSGDVRKAVLREVARMMDLGELAERKKKAAQYGSGSMRTMKAAAKSRSTTVRSLVLELSRRGEV